MYFTYVMFMESLKTYHFKMKLIIVQNLFIIELFYNMYYEWNEPSSILKCGAVYNNQLLQSLK